MVSERTIVQNAQSGATLREVMESARQGNAQSDRRTCSRGTRARNRDGVAGANLFPGSHRASRWIGRSRRPRAARRRSRIPPYSKFRSASAGESSESRTRLASNRSRRRRALVSVTDALHLDRLGYSGYSAESGSLCIAPAIFDPKNASAPGLYCEPEKLSVKIDAQLRNWHLKESLKVTGFDLTTRYRVTVLCDRKPQQSFTFRFSEYKIKTTLSFPQRSL